MITENKITISKFKYLYISIFKKWNPGRFILIIKLNTKNNNSQCMSKLFKTCNSKKFVEP